ncbi:diaminopimelate decarboxylase [Algoriphagus sediminis]|uniref:Diaminopimelate decarboxylase n=1 Tax=Algoriphagus sediminis TaxID=3057113 RepID=A0ABT7YCG4_9BACT|nr:diaminopimelate decarboxylase [Algoriphagus sediminis]MDN3204161.1 diaminopimelate decarboxylase [Algoriphagus sediminis]
MFEVKRKEIMQVQGLELTDIAEEFGTPLFVYDGEKIVQQINKLKNGFSGAPTRIKYAVKALTNVSILKLMKSQGIGVDAVSIEEIKLCMHAGYEPSEIMYTPNCVGFDEIKEAVELGAMINLDNLPMLEKFGQAYGGKVPVAIRINPRIMAGGNSKISVGHIHSKFGIPTSQLPEVIQIAEKYGMVINGLHVHTGSDILDAEVFLRGANVLFQEAPKFPDLKFIDFGGGFKIAYREDDPSTDMERVGREVTAAFNEFCKSYGHQLELWLEPGKFLVSEAGTLLVETNVVKETPEIAFVGVNSGLNHLIRPMFYDAYHEVINISGQSKEKKPYNVVGYICETDTLAADRKLEEVKEGDILAFKNAGAYSFSMASNYNSRLRPAEVLVWKGKANLIRKKEEFADLLKNQVILDI